MRAVALHSDVIVVTSRIWQTTCTLVRAGAGEGLRVGAGVGVGVGVGEGEGESAPAGEGFVIDSPILPDELELLAQVAQQAGFAVDGLLATHADWDHMLGPMAFPGMSLGCAQSTCERLGAAAGAVQRGLRDFDERHYVVRQGPLGLGEPQPLPVPGRLDVSDRELELHPATGHTGDGMAVWIPWARVLVCGDYLSPVEIPMLGEGGSLEAYGATLERLEPLVGAAEHVVPGHGHVLDGGQASAILGEDRAYVDALGRDPEAAERSLPRGRSDAQQRRVHAENVARL